MANHLSVRLKSGIHGRTKRRLWQPLEHMPRIYVGIGNPNCNGIRHNVGMDWLDYFANKMDLKWHDEKDLESYVAYFEECDLILVKPKRYMNMQGIVVSKILNQLKRPIEDCVLIHDCLNTTFGTWRCNDKTDNQLSILLIYYIMFEILRNFWKFLEISCFCVWY